MTLTDRITQSVANGAALLDRVDPEWAARIALDRLAMETCDQCILGQLYGNYQDGFFRVTRPLPSHQLFFASEFGFTAGNSDDFAPLAEAWRAEVRKRLEHQQEPSR